MWNYNKLQSTLNLAAHNPQTYFYINLVFRVQQWDLSSFLHFFFTLFFSRYVSVWNRHCKTTAVCCQVGFNGVVIVLSTLTKPVFRDREVLLSFWPLTKFFEHHKQHYCYLYYSGAEAHISEPKSPSLKTYTIFMATYHSW